MIVEEYKFIFIHIPNNGGTTIGNILHPNLLINGQPKTYGMINDKDSKHYAEHRSYNFYKSITPNIDDFFIFSFVRNPFSRLFSAWRQGCKGYKDNPNFKYYGIDKTKTNINSFLYDAQDKNLFHGFVNCIYNELHQIDKLVIFQSKFIDKTNMDFIGRFENYANDLRSVLNLINQHIGKNIFVYNDIHLNKKSLYADEYKEYYNSLTKALCKYMFYRDFEAFGYDYINL